MNGKGIQVNGQEHDPAEKRKRVLRYLRLWREGWPEAVLIARTKLSKKRAKELAKQFGIEWR